jgi:hypothetical protein
MSKYEKCMATIVPTLKKRGFDNHDKLAANMCNMWADENGVEREFAIDGKSSAEPVSRSFALSLGEDTDMTFATDNDGLDSVSFPVIAITSGPHSYEEDGIGQKVYIEPSVLKSNIEAFKELPIYINHQRTPEDLIGMATEPEVFEMDDGKIGVKMNAKVDNKTGHGQEVINKVKDGDMTHVSIDWLSNDVDVMGDTFATNIKPTEVSFIDNEKMDPVCKECTIEDGKECEHSQPEDEEQKDCCDSCKEGKECCEDGKTEVDTMTEETNVKSDAENIVEREFASLRSQLEEVQASKKEIESQYDVALKEIEAFKLAEEERAAKEAEERKLQTVDAIISKEMLFNTVTEENKEARQAELAAWDEMKLTGFSEALAAIPEQHSEETDRQFGKGKATDGEPVPVVEKESSVSVDNRGRFKIDTSKFRGN